MKKVILSFLILSLIGSYSFANFAINNSEQSVSKEWKLFMEKDGIQVFYSYEDCHDIINNVHQEILVLKLVNNTNSRLLLSWDLKMWYDDNCSNCDVKNDPENHFSLILKPGETKIGSCENRTKNRELNIYSKNLDSKFTAILSKFEMQNFLVKLF
jgi:hypothetical protein